MVFVCVCWFSPSPGERGGQRPSGAAAPRRRRRGQVGSGGAGSLTPSILLPSRPPGLCCCSRFEVWLRALGRSHVVPGVSSAATSPPQASKTLTEQGGRVILRPCVHPAGSRGMLCVDVLVSWIFAVGPPGLGQRGEAELYPILTCLAARPAALGRGRPSRLPAARSWCPRRCETLQLSLSSPCPRFAGERGPERLHCHRWVPVARGSVRLPPQRGVILLATRSQDILLLARSQSLDGCFWGFPG